MNPELTARAKAISRFKKERYLLSLSEDEFRDKVVRPVFLRLCLEDGRDCCGPMEAGKDVIFELVDPLGLVDIYVVQTKKGNINLGRKADQNLIAAVTQLKTACETLVRCPTTRQKKKPTKVVLCVSGRINENAREHICDEVKDPRLVFLDRDDLLPKIDEHLPELWFEMDAKVLPYLKALRTAIEKDTQLFTKGELVASSLPPVAISEEFFAPIRAVRFTLRRKSIKGVVKQVPAVEELPVTGVLSRKERLILMLGGAGAGKSTAILRMIYLLCQRWEESSEKSDVPVFMRAQALAESPEAGVLDLVYRAAEELVGRGNAPFGSSDLEEGRVVVFVDALDELADLEPQERLAQNLLDFHRMYPKCKIVLTSRESPLLDKNSALSGYTTFRIGSMNFRQAKTIVKRLLKPRSLQSEAAEEFLRRLQEVHGFELNPLIVTVFAATTEGGRQEVPANITELFKKFTEFMLGRWDETKGLSQQYQAPLKDYILQQIAFVMHSRRSSSIPANEFRQLVAHELEKRGYEADVSVLTNEILQRSSLFRIVADRVEFRHLMLQEFFAGRALQPGPQLEGVLGDDWWRMALVFFFGDNPNQGQLILELAEKASREPPPVMYDAAIALGLATQASYLATIDEKIPALAWVIASLSAAFKDFQTRVLTSAKYPLQCFLNYYLFAREALASSLLADRISDIEVALEKRPTSEQNECEFRRFWIISGLVEAGKLGRAEELLQRFKPVDKRLTLGIYLGAFLAAYHRVTTHDERNAAKRIIQLTVHHLDELRRQLQEEFKSELLEVQEKKVKALPARGQDNCL